MASVQTLTEAERRAVAAWAADCAERVVAVFEAEVPGDGRPRDAIARARAFARGELAVAEAIRCRFAGGRAAGEAASPAGAASARAAAQASAVAHMGAHALGAAAYAARAAGLAEPDDPRATTEEVGWQLAHMTPEVRAALARLPALGVDAAGPLGPGLLASDALAPIVRAIQSDLVPAGRPGASRA